MNNNDNKDLCKKPEPISRPKTITNSYVKEMHKLGIPCFIGFLDNTTINGSKMRFAGVMIDEIEDGNIKFKDHIEDYDKLLRFGIDFKKEEYFTEINQNSDTICDK